MPYKKKHLALHATNCWTDPRSQLFGFPVDLPCQLNIFIQLHPGNDQATPEELLWPTAKHMDDDQVVTCLRDVHRVILGSLSWHPEVLSFGGWRVDILLIQRCEKTKKLLTKYRPSGYFGRMIYIWECVSPSELYIHEPAYSKWCDKRI